MLAAGGTAHCTTCARRSLARSSSLQMPTGQPTFPFSTRHGTAAIDQQMAQLLPGHHTCLHGTAAGDTTWSSAIAPCEVSHQLTLLERFCMQSGG